MALVWAESFDLYGTIAANLTQRGYASNTVTLINNVTTSRTGTGCVTSGSGAGQAILLRLNPVAMNACTQGCAFWWQAASSSLARNNPGFYFRIGGALTAIRVVLTSALGFEVYAGTTLIGVSAPNQFVLQSWFHMEAQVISGTGTGIIEVRINGVTCILITGLTIGLIEGYAIGRESTSGMQNCNYDDWTVTDGTGTINNGFIGDRRCVTSYTNADTAEADWTRTPAGPGWSILDNMPPNDAQFVEAGTVGDISEFEMQDIGIATNDIAGIVIIGRAAKIDAGVATFRLGINSAGTIDNGPAETPNVAPSFSYFSRVVERNPNGGVPWNRTTANAALARITRET